MLNQNEEVEIFEEEEIITFTDDAGNQFDYLQIACVEYEGEFFLLMESANETESEDDGLYILKILNYENVDEDWEVEPVENDELANVVFDKFIKVFQSQCVGDCKTCPSDCKK